MVSPLVSLSCTFRFHGISLRNGLGYINFLHCTEFKDAIYSTKPNYIEFQDYLELTLNKREFEIAYKYFLYQLLPALIDLRCIAILSSVVLRIEVLCCLLPKDMQMKCLRRKERRNGIPQMV